eukprot:5895591-Ditylum_brightwellii.AAC.1
MADVGHCWWRGQEPTSSTPIKKAVGKTDSRQKVGSNSKKLAVAAMARSKTAAMAMVNQDGDAKPVEMGTGIRQKGACHT